MSIGSIIYDILYTYESTYSPSQIKDINLFIIIKSLNRGVLENLISTSFSIILFCLWWREIWNFSESIKQKLLVMWKDL